MRERLDPNDPHRALHRFSDVMLSGRLIRSRQLDQKPKLLVLPPERTAISGRLPSLNARKNPGQPFQPCSPTVRIP